MKAPGPAYPSKVRTIRGRVEAPFLTEGRVSDQASQPTLRDPDVSAHEGQFER